jgi:hypothetical protein
MIKRIKTTLNYISANISIVNNLYIVKVVDTNDIFQEFNKMQYPSPNSQSHIVQQDHLA